MRCIACLQTDAVQAKTQQTTWRIAHLLPTVGSPMQTGRVPEQQQQVFLRWYRCNGCPTGPYPGIGNRACAGITSPHRQGSVEGAAKNVRGRKFDEFPVRPRQRHGGAAGPARMQTALWQWGHIPERYPQDLYHCCTRWVGYRVPLAQPLASYQQHGERSVAGSNRVIPVLPGRISAPTSVAPRLPLRARLPFAPSPDHEVAFGTVTLRMPSWNFVCMPEAFTGPGRVNACCMLLA